MYKENFGAKTYKGKKQFYFKSFVISIIYSQLQGIQSKERQGFSKLTVQMFKKIKLEVNTTSVKYRSIVCKGKAVLR